MFVNIVPITPGQIGKAQELLAAALRKSNFPSEQVQQVFENQGGTLVDEWIGSLRKRVEAISDTIVRRVKVTVNRGRSPQEALVATGRKQYTINSVVDSMPKGEGDEVEVILFNLYRFVSDNDLEKEYEIRGLKPADPYSLAAVNEADPTFADEHPNGTHWKDANGQWCYAIFYRWEGDRKVGVFQCDIGWSSRCWFAGLRKQ